MEFSSEGTREERAFKFWMQSLGVQVRSLVDDVQDGLVILGVLDKISYLNYILLLSMTQLLH